MKFILDCETLYQKDQYLFHSQDDFCDMISVIYISVKYSIST